MKKYVFNALFFAAFVSLASCYGDVKNDLTDEDADVNDQLWDGYGESHEPQSKHNEMPKLH
ncbi:hypothetical protein Paes_1715 [Prosthecochloris aestuarii DSM 271]|uniref:Lipoprotein n=1 Tax=Prosthecochloris aestuarii (strain DSM 271 / SK 413) TaxID=290512 RepID=B4S3J4_PROA2|nr:hypothetical protein [Prosthecochloris aestuarii]ACF46733.1 hypothetical protein Paes_1715 [Prosthecochloris aestuarii DSM 271]